MYLILIVRKFRVQKELSVSRNSTCYCELHAACEHCRALRPPRFPLSHCLLLPSLLLSLIQANYYIRECRYRWLTTRVFFLSYSTLTSAPNYRAIRRLCLSGQAVLDVTLITWAGTWLNSWTLCQDRYTRLDSSPFDPTQLLFTK